ncbi:MAG: phosphoglycerate dehydrogenase [Bacillota bacterium]
MKVLFTYNYGEDKLNEVRKLGYELIYIHEGELNNKAEVEDIDVLVCYNPFERLDISKLNKLKWIQLSSIGIDQLPKAVVKEKGIIVTNNKSGYSIPMGEWIVMKSLELIKNSKYFYNNQKDSLWRMDTSVQELYGKTISFIGTGSIASEAAKRLQGFEVNILGVNTTGKAVEYFNQCYAMKDLMHVLAESDIVVLSVPYTELTHHLINKDNLRHLKENSYLINISRGSVINEADLITAILEGKIRGAALDVFEEEPLPKDSPLWKLENVIITPHNSWVSEMRNERRYAITFENLRRYITGEELMNIVDIKKGY